LKSCIYASHEHLCVGDVTRALEVLLDGEEGVKRDITHRAVKGRRGAIGESGVMTSEWNLGVIAEVTHTRFTCATSTEEGTGAGTKGETVSAIGERQNGLSGGRGRRGRRRGGGGGRCGSGRER
jgi:hypothetical protein